MERRDSNTASAASNASLLSVQHDTETTTRSNREAELSLSISHDAARWLDDHRRRHRDRLQLDEVGAMTISKFRSFLYALARFLGDVQAVRRHRVAERVARRVAGRFTSRILRGLFR